MIRSALKYIIETFEELVELIGYLLPAGFRRKLRWLKERIFSKLWFRGGLGILLVFFGIFMLLGSTIESDLVSKMSKDSYNQHIVTGKPHNKGMYDFSKVKAASPKNAVQARLSLPSDVVGKLSVPELGVKVSIYLGVSNANLNRGAGTMKPNQQMGQGNYTLAGHHMDNDDSLLFGPLARAKTGQVALLTDGKYVYTYRIISRREVTKYAVNVLNDVRGKCLLTMITCAQGGKTRWCVTGTLVKTQRLTKHLQSIYFA